VKQVQKRKNVVNQRAVMIKQVICGTKLIKELSSEPFLETIDLNIVIDDPKSVVEVVSSVTGGDLNTVSY
jgi:aspartyl aminopeptidase